MRGAVELINSDGLGDVSILDCFLYIIRSEEADHLLRLGYDLFTADN